MLNAGNERKVFTDLINDLCRVLSYSEHQDGLRDDEILVMEMSLEDIPFTVSHSLICEPGSIIIAADFGPVPAERTCEVLFRLLHLNRELSESGTAALSLDQASATVVYTQAQILRSSSGSGLLTTMKEIAWRAQYWQETHFLQTPPSSYGGTENDPFIFLV